MMRIKPKSMHGVVIDDAFLTKILNAFEIPSNDVEYISPILISRDECVVLESKSDTAKKLVLRAKGSDYLLKEIPWYCDTPTDISFRHDFTRGLISRGIPVPKLRESGHGQTWADIEGRRFEIQMLLDGGTFTGSLQEISSAGALLSKLHNASEKIELDNSRRARHLPVIAIDHVNLLERDRASNILELKNFVVQMRAETERLNTEVIELTKKLPRPIGVHGDFSPWNVLFVDGEASGVIDFDNACVDFATHDVAEAILTYCALGYRQNSTNFSKYIPSSFDVPKVRVFLSGYMKNRPIDDAEQYLLSAYIQLTWIELASLGLNRGDFRLSEVPSICNYLQMLKNMDYRQLLFGAA